MPATPAVPKPKEAFIQRRIAREQGSSKDLIAGAPAPSHSTLQRRLAREQGKQKEQGTLKNLLAGAPAPSHSALTAVKDLKHNVKEKINQKADAFLEKQILRILVHTGELVKEGAKAPGMPDFMIRYIDHAHQFLWDDVEKELLEGVMLKHGMSGDEFSIKQTALQFWVRNRPVLWPEGERFPWVWRWVRARFLHATQPAEETFWQNVRDPQTLCVFILALYPGTSVFLFFLTFICINKSDEFQLVNFILKFKGAQFFSAGLIPAAKVGMGLFFSCYHHVHSQGLEGLELPELCVVPAPGLHARHLLVLEPVRLILVYAAALLLRAGAYGGVEEIKALESVRIDAADGELDGVVERKVLMQKKHSHHTDDVEASSREITTESKHAALQLAREDFGTGKKIGFLLTYFVAYDACVVVFLLCAILAPILIIHEPLWMLWVSLYYARIMYSLLSFPFLLFLVPIVGSSLHHAKPTAYDKQGMLVPKLSTAQIKMKLKREEAEAKKGHHHGHHHHHHLHLHRSKPAKDQGPHARGHSAGSARILVSEAVRTGSTRPGL